MLTTYPTSSERTAALVAHAGTLFCWFFAPLAVYLIKRGESKYVEHHAMQSLFWSLLGTLLAAVTCGLVVPVFLVVHVYAAVKILRGEEFEYPVAGPMARTWVFGA